jgi:hypothetical protein
MNIKLFALVGLAVALVACPGLPLGARFTAEYTPAKIDVTRTETFDKTTGAFLGSSVAYVLTQPQATFISKTGSLAATIESAIAQFKDGANQPISVGTDVAVQGIGVTLPYGRQCPVEKKPCRLGAADTIFADGDPVTASLFLIDKPVADAIAGEIAGFGTTGVRQYRVGLKYQAVDSNFVPFSQTTQDASIAVSLNVVKATN